MRLSDHFPPAVVLGGGVNALSIARSLGSTGVRVFAINQPNSEVRYSRFSQWVDVRQSGSSSEAWAEYLLGPGSNHLSGAVLLAGSDEAIEIITAHRDELSRKFILDLSNPTAQLCMLNKVSTYEAASAAGVPTPRFWNCDSQARIEALKDDLLFPLLLKPRISHQFAKIFGTKFKIVRSYSELLSDFTDVNSAGIETFLVEKIPGPDDRLCSYYSYLDENGDPQFRFTKRIIRRYPVGMGNGSYHITDDVPEIDELSLRLFKQVGLLGIVNAEFKFDERDGQLKLIECNARFTAADCLLQASGVNLPLFVYRRLIGQPIPAPANYRLGLRLWYPLEDYLACRELRRAGQLTFWQWAHSVLHPHVLPVFQWTDPAPTVVRSVQVLKSSISRRIASLTPPSRTAQGESAESARAAAAVSSTRE